MKNILSKSIAAALLVSAALPALATTYQFQIYSKGVQPAVAPTFSTTFTVPDAILGITPPALVAPTSNSSGAFTFTSSNPSVAAVSGSTLTLMAAGQATITAMQASSGKYTAVSSAATLTVNPAPVAVTWSTDAPSTYYGISADKLTVDEANGNRFALATVGKSSGKWYWEVTLTVANPYYADMGVGTTGSVSGFSGIRQDYINSNGGYIVSGSGGYGNVANSNFAPGDVVAFAFDADNHTLAFYRNNVYQRTLPGLPSGIQYPAVGLEGGNGVVNHFTANFGAAGFKYTPPTGFIKLQ